jgi:NADH-quinone oxidoreductase subunit L
MVTAGVYMVCRSAAVYVQAPLAMDVVAFVGLLTAVMAATIGMTQWDIKKVFAYSTVSQLGFMFLAAGSGAFGAAMWHVVTHAFFKALLFLGAGSVIHAMHHEQDMRHMGGLRRYIPITFGTLACAWIAISGFPLTSGWFSKEEILGAAHHHSAWMYWVALATATVTAFYVSRAMFLTFFGEFRGAAALAAGHGGHQHNGGHHQSHGHDHSHANDHGQPHDHGHHDAAPHESPASMWIPLAVLAVLSLVGGFWNVPHFLEPVLPHAAHIEHSTLDMIIGSSAGILGILLAWFVYIANPGMAGSITARLGSVYRLVYDKYCVDEFYDMAVVQPTIGGSKSVLWKGLDAGFVDGLVNGAGGLARVIGGIARWIQTGNIRSYGTWVVLGSVAAIVMLTMATGGLK